MNGPRWTDLVVEDRLAPPRVSEDEFSDWLSNTRLFVSSTIDDEMLPFREAVRSWSYDHGAVPVMWEELVPRDQDPVTSYLSGVDQSDIFVLLLGHRYGTSDSSGYSPTHAEANRAKHIGIPRLAFQPSSVRDADRDGRLVDWVRSLYAEISIAKFDSVADLDRLLELRLRELAAASTTIWIKLDRFIFPGSIWRGDGDGGRTFQIDAMLRNPVLRREIESIGHRSSSLRLTWGAVSHIVHDVRSETKSTARSSDSVRLTGTFVSPWNEPRAFMPGGMTIMQASRAFTPSDQAEIWLKSELIGAVPDAFESNLSRPTALYELPPLAEIALATAAKGWLLEGIVGLYVTEALTYAWGGHIDRLDVGPVITNGIPVRVDFTPEHQPLRTISVNGIFHPPSHG